MKRQLCFSLMAMFIISLGLTADSAEKEMKASRVRKATIKKTLPVKKMIPSQKNLPKTGLKERPSDGSAEENKSSELVGRGGNAFVELNGKNVAAASLPAKLGGVVFFQWQKPVQNVGTAVSNYDVTRAYVDIKKELDRGAQARLTLDISRITGAAKQNLFEYLKYAYVDLPLEVPNYFKLIPNRLNIKLGLQQTVWIDWADKALNLRYIAKSLVDNEGVMSSADFGVGVGGKLRIAELPEVEYSATLLNGTGYSAAESNAAKDIGLRVNSTVYNEANVGKVLLGLYGNLTDVGFSSAIGSKLIGGLVAFKNDLSIINLEYLRGTKKNGYSLGGIFQVLPQTNLFARLDHYNPDTTVSNKELDRTYYGVTYDWSKDVKLAVDLQNVTGGTSAATSAGQTTSYLYLHTMIVL